ncbi:hypothetical protein BUALT_Bualt13G0074700 [Buddleja alternifolia]|uniref:Helicase protein MOM1 n=1 Tax=Buddleja alternifolia TaxID=168488 RepID=A0AAV6WM94_9LAMI|nr:hypothetical protein BUALT_Bualt13G0074700 [Buddleja alternifolia]
MVSDTRSARKNKDEADGHNSKNNINIRKDSSINSPGKSDASGVRRSGRETSLSRQMTPSPPSTRKSKRLEKGIPPLTPPMKRKSERLEKHNTPSPLRKSERGKKNLLSSSPGSRQSAKELTLSELKRKKQKSLIQVTMESEKVEPSTKRKKMNAKTFKGLFKKQCIKKILPDVGEELEGPDESSHVFSDNTGERMATNCSSAGNIDVPKSESSTCFARSLDGSVSSESVAEATPSLAKHESCSLLGACVHCSKNKRISYDSPEQELCSCYHTGDKDLGSISTCKDRGVHEAAVTLESTEECDSRNLKTETHADYQMDGHDNLCALCNKDGELLFCVGKGCKRCYHLCCLDPPLTDVLPGVWHCPQCVKKKLLFGVHSVSERVESIWDVREVDVSNGTGIRQRQYLVQYHGLAHIHNLWVPEKQVLLENPSLVSNYNAQIMRWSAEWILPHRLLRRRPIQDKIYVASSAVISVCNYEWLVKWKGLNYNHATWELDSANFLSSSLGQNLMKDYEVRREKARQEVKKHDKGSFIKLSELPGGQSPVNDNCLLENVNKLRECWFKCQNAVVFDNQERAVTVIYSIGSMIENSGPFLIIAASSSLSLWEAEFARLVPSVDVVVYSGNRDTRKGIRASEFYEEGGHVLLQVLLSSREAVFEDLDILRSIKWEAVVIDDYQHSGISNDFEQIKMLNTDSGILLLIGQIKDTTSEYLKILSLLEPHGDFDKLRGSKSETNDNLCKLKDRLSRFIAYGSIYQASKFIEYWVPVQISNFQLEQYCATLLSNSMLLGSCSRNDPVGSLRETLHSVRKCCDHPYLLDSSVQQRLIAELRPATEILDIGIKASGKLQLLDLMLTEIKTLGLQVLVLFQLITGSGGTSTGNILDDFLRQRFGPNTYERVDAGVIPSKKQAAAHRFNKKEKGQFVFLLENRACSSAIKFSSLDLIIIYDGDWNPAIDLRALQKISVDSKVEQIKVFRLYSSCTVEERALVLAKKNLNLENNLQTLSRATSDSLLSWGASYLFSKLGEYHADSNSASDLDFSSEQSLSNEVIKEFQAILSESSEKNDFISVISKVKLGVGSYSTNIPMLGEAKVQLKDGEEPRVFWKNLLDGKNPQWKHLKGPCPRNRKRIHYLEGSPSKGELGNDDVVKKRKKVVHENCDQVELGVQQETPVAASKEGLSTIKACNQSQSLQRDNTTSNNNLNCTSGSSLIDEVSVGASEKIVVPSDEKKSLHSFLQGEMTRLCQILKLSDNVTHIVRNFLEHVIKNHHVNSDSPAIVQAFQISLCWIAASISKQKVDKKGSLMLAKQLLNYQCTEEQAISVYLKMRSLKRMYLQSSENIISNEPTNVNKDGLQCSSIKQQNGKMEIGEKSANEDKLGLKDEAVESAIYSTITKIQKKCSKRMKKLIRKQKEEIQEFNRIWEGKMKNLEGDHKLESAVIRSLHVQGSLRMDKLKVLDDNFAKKMEEHNLLKEIQLKDLEAKQLAARDEEREKANQWLAEAKARSSEPRSVSAGDPQSNTCNDDVAPPVTSVLEALGCDAPVVTRNNTVTVNSENNGDGNVSVDPPAPVEWVSDEIRSTHPNEEFQIEVPETVTNEVTGHETSKESSKEYDKGNLPDALVNHRDGLDVAASIELPSPVQPLVHPEQTADLQDCCDCLPQQVLQDTTNQNLVSAELQEQDVPAVENQRTLQIEVPTSGLVTVNHVPSNLEAPITDDFLTSVQSNNEAPLTENSEQLQPVSLNYNPSPSVEFEHQIHDQERNSSQTAEQSISQCGESLELNGNNLVTGPVNRVAHEPNFESSASSQNNVPIPQAVVSTAELPNRAALQLRIDVGYLNGSNYLPTHLATSWNSSPSLLSDPLHTELERIRKETEQLEKTHDDTMSKLRSDCEKEIQEIIAQIRNKYDARLQDTESEFRLKRNDLDKNQRKILMNKILAEAFRSKCLDLRPSGLPGVSSSFMQQLQQLAVPPPIRPPPGTPTLSHQNSTPASTGHAMQQLSRSHPMRSSPVTNQSVSGSMRSSPIANQSVSTPPVQPVRDVADLFSGPSPRPPLISPITPTPNPASSRPPLISAITPSPNPTRLSGEIRSAAPHLQPFRPTSSTHSATSPSLFQSRPHSQPVILQPPPPPPSPPRPLPPPRVQSTNFVSQSGIPSPSIPNLSSLELVKEMDRRAFMHDNRPSSPLPEICSNFSSLELSDLETLGNVQGNQTSTAIATDVVCLSDDD